MKPNKCFRLWSILILPLLFGCSGRVDTQKLEPAVCGDYRIIEDRKDIQIVAAVPSNIQERDLKCVLTEVADMHQFDKDRDYLTSDYLWVIVFLDRAGQLSNLPAAKLRRTVPLDKSVSAHADEANRFYFFLTEARSSF